jgi:Ala-tRNA(Pro) deacylase
MAIAPTFQKYLADRNIEYDIIPHEPTMSSARTAEACRISGDCLAKGIVLRGKDGYLLAVLPASHHVRLADLRTQLGEDLDLATENEIDQLFRDCAHGAVPPAGECYGLDVIIDDSIENQPDVYLEAGDHATLVHLTHAQFARLNSQARHGHFSVHN